MIGSLFQKLKRAVLVGALGLVISGVTARPAHAIPVVDAPHIAQSIINTADNIAKWATYISQFRTYYSTFNAVYQGVKNWNEMGWLDLLQLAELPCFDGLDGIDDIRNICSGVEMSITDLQQIFADIKWLERMMNDPAYAKSEGLRERTRIMRVCSQRSMRRKMAITRVMKTMQKENDRLVKQSKAIQSKIEMYSGMDPAPTATIQGLNAKLLVIQTKMQNNKETLYAQIKTMEEQQAAELAQLQSELQCNIDDLRRSNTAIKRYWGNFLSVSPGGAI